MNKTFRNSCRFFEKSRRPCNFEGSAGNIESRIIAHLGSIDRWSFGDDFTHTTKHRRMFEAR